MSLTFVGLGGLQHLLNPIFLELTVSGHNAHYEEFTGDAVILDPGDGETLIVDRNQGMVELETSSAETRTLEDPSKSGVLLTLTLKTDGGNCVVTADTAVNATGNNTLTFGDAGDTILLTSIPDGSSGFKWKALANDGVSLSTV